MLQKLLNSLYLFVFIVFETFEKGQNKLKYFIWNISRSQHYPVSSRPSQVGVLSKRVNRSTDRAGFGTEASFNLSYTVIGKVGYLKK